MTWRVVSALSIGTSHVANGTQCQDDCWAFVEQSQHGEILTIFVADGAGSALKGGEGAALAVQAAVRFFGDAMHHPTFNLVTAQSADCMTAIRTAIEAEAQATGLASRDFACTFLGLVSYRSHTLTFQIGDGGIVLDTGDGLRLATTPMTGEYANMTHFVTQSDCLAKMVARLDPGPVRRAAVFSDGIQRLALNMTEGTPHEPFFLPFFEVLARATAAQEDSLTGQLAAFLGSAQVNERTDDDKSLALAVWTE